MIYRKPTPTEPAGLWHKGDPDTSKRAAIAASAHGVLKAHQGEVLMLVRQHPGLTARELATKGTLDYYQISRRCCELVRIGIVKRQGERNGCSCLWPVEA